MSSAKPGGHAAPPKDLSVYGWMSLLVGITVFLLKLGAWWVTGSVGLLSDALESTVNIVAAIVALLALRAASRPGDDEHHFGHGKAEYLSALVEGLMILLAATFIIITAVERLLNPRPLEDVGIGLAISAVASVLNGLMAAVLISAGRKHRSIVLTADGKHLLTDVWTSVGVLVGVGLVALTGIETLDPLVAIAVAINILVAGWFLVRDSTEGLMDAALPREDHEAIRAVLQRHAGPTVVFHAIQTRRSGRERFLSMHVLVPGEWTVQRGHDLLEQVESDLRSALEHLTVQTHLEPIEDPRAWQDLPPGGVDLSA